MLKKVLVVGGAGFVGSHLCEALVSADYQVTCVDDLSTGSADNIRHLSALRVVEGDANGWQVWEDLRKEKFAAVFHYAAVVGVQRTSEEPSRVLDDVLGIRNLIRFAREGAAARVIFSSSSEVYGEPQRLPEREDDRPVAWNPYATIKLYGEHALQALWKHHQIPTVSLRFFNVYGPRQDGSPYGFVTAQFLRQALAGEAPTVFGDGTQTRDFVYIGDNIRAALAALTADDIGGEVINVGTGQETAVKDLAQEVIKAVGKEGTLEPDFLPARRVDVRRRCASVEKLQGILGVTCDTPLALGLARTISFASARRVPAS